MYIHECMQEAKSKGPMSKEEIAARDLKALAKEMELDPVMITTCASAMNMSLMQLESLPEVGTRGLVKGYWAASAECSTPGSGC